MVAKKSRGKKVSKKAVMKGGPPLGLKPLPSYLEGLLKLSRGELEGTLANMKQITSVSHARELKRAKITGRNLLLDIVKYDESEVLDKREREEAEKHSKMNAVIEEVAKGEDLEENIRSFQAFGQVSRFAPFRTSALGQHMFRGPSAVFGGL